MLLEEFQKAGKYLFQEGLVSSHGGSLSVREGDKIIITRQDAMLGNLEERDLVEVGLGQGSEDGQASRSLAAHRALYRETKAAAIISALPPSAIAVSITDNKIIPQDAEGSSRFRSAAIVRPHPPGGAEEIARLLPSFLQGASVIAAVKGAGSYAIGKNLEEAYLYTSALENSCKILVAVRSSQAIAVKPPAPRERMERRSAIPPGIGVMDRSRYHKR